MDGRTSGAMSSAAIPPAVEQFILDSIDTVPHLEALLLIFQTPGTAWSVQELAARIYVNDKQAAAILDDLTRRALITRVEQSPAKYQFISRSQDQTQLLDQVAQAYRTQLVQVTRFIHSNASASVRDFARAFRLKDRD
jgi:DNA-binding MarR family transcriptional regulator